MDFVVAVRTYDRAALFQRATLRILRDQNLLNRLTVFVGSDIAAYKEREPDLHYVSVPKGLGAATRAICEYYPRHTPILFLDDDLETWWGGDLGELTRKAFETSTFWGFGSTTNKFWLRNQAQWGPKYTVCRGSAFGATNIPELIVSEFSHCEDIHRTAKYLRAGITPMRYNHAGFKTQYVTNAGGLQSSGERKDTKAISEQCAADISDWITGIVLLKEGVWVPKLISSAAIKKKLSTSLTAPPPTQASHTMTPDFVVAVRTYERAAMFQRATLRILRDQNLIDRLTVFVGSDLAAYKELEPDLRYVTVPKGGANAIRAICDYYPRGTPILFLDDDLEKWWGGDLGELTRKAFETSTFWGFGYLTNKLWLSKLPQWGPKYSVLGGCGFGATNVPELVTTEHGHGDDIVRTVQYLRAGITPMCYYHAGFKTRYTKNPGGLQSSGERADTKAIAELISVPISDWVSKIYSHKDGVWVPALISPAAIKRRLQLQAAANLTTPPPTPPPS